MCLIFGLLPFTVILMTASLSSRRNNFALPECGGIVQGTTSTCDRISSTPFSLDEISPFGGFLDAEFLSEFAGAKTSITCSHRIKRGMPSSLVLASKAITSDSVDEWETAPCFLQIHVMGTNVLGPTSTRYAPVVDFESSRLSAKLASENNVSLQCSGGSPTHEVWTLSPLWRR